MVVVLGRVNCELLGIICCLLWFEFELVCLGVGVLLWFLFDQ